MIAVAEPVYHRRFARASHRTFTIPPIADLVDRYVGDGKGWADPFSGWNSPAQFTNDDNPEAPTRWHLDAYEFSVMLARLRVRRGTLRGVLFDPPYSYRQISEHYKHMGRKATKYDTSYRFYRRIMNQLGPLVRPGGFVISFGWDTNGFGKKAGFRVIEVLDVHHGLHHHDTLCTVEQRIA